MIDNYKPYIRRKEMDSVLTYLVESRSSPDYEIQKSLKKLFERDNLQLFRDTEHSLSILISSLDLKQGGEVILSALTPINYFILIKSMGFNPVVVDVSLDSGQILESELHKVINDKTVLIVNWYMYNFKRLNFESNNIPQINIFDSGIVGSTETNKVPALGKYNIISLESSSIINSEGGSIVLYSENELDYIDQKIKLNPKLILQGLNASYLKSQIDDLEIFFSKQNKITDIYRASLLKSGYTTLELGEYTTCNSFTVVVKRGASDIIRYCKSQGVEILRAFNNSIAKNYKLKVPNARSLCNRTLLFPLSLSLKKESIELISKILSTLP